MSAVNKNPVEPFSIQLLQVVDDLDRVKCQLKSLGQFVEDLANDNEGPEHIMLALDCIYDRAHKGLEESICALNNIRKNPRLETLG